MRDAIAPLEPPAAIVIDEEDERNNSYGNFIKRERIEIEYLMIRTSLVERYFYSFL